MYHINNQMKVMKCRARVMACPYGLDAHSENVEELYYKIMKSEKTSNYSIGAAREIDLLGRIVSFQTLSNEIADSSAPVELILETLEYSLNKVQKHGNKRAYGPNSEIDYIMEQAAGDVTLAEAYNLNYVGVPARIQKMGRDVWKSEYGGRIVEDATITSDTTAWNAKRRLDRKRQDGTFQLVNKWEKYKLAPDNYESTEKWLRNEFISYSHDLNTSKLIAQPVFFGDVEAVEKEIKNMPDDDLMSAYDDYLVSDKEIKAAVEQANGFNYTPRKDLSKEANDRLKEWYDINRRIWNNRTENKAKRIQITFMLANEIDQRGLQRTDAAVRSE